MNWTQSNIRLGIEKEKSGFVQHWNRKWDFNYENLINGEQSKDLYVYFIDFHKSIR